MKIQSLAMALAAALAVPAGAATDAARQQAVRYKDLDLTTEAGREKLDRRLNAAAREVCGMDKTLVGSRIASSESRKCYRDARRKLDDQIATLTGRVAPGA